MESKFGFTYPLPELLDRMSIVKIKIQKFPRESKSLTREFNTYEKAIKTFNWNPKEIKKWLNELYKINKKIWSLEANIRKGDINDIPLSEVGKIAIKIRHVNGFRVKLKGDIAEKTGSGFRDIKINHASEETSK